MLITSDIVSTLIEIGRREHAGGNPEDSLRAVGEHDRINYMHWKEWSQIAQTLNDDDLASLAIGLVSAEEEHRWGGGSGAAVISVFRDLTARNSALADAVADWILPRTSNTYAPYGTHNFGVHTAAEYRVKREERRQRKDRRKRDLELEQAVVRSRRAALQVQRNASAALRGTTARQAFLEALKRLTVVEQLWQLANDPEHPVTFYPTCCAASADAGVIRTLDTDVVVALAKKLVGRHRGPWGQFKTRLRTVRPEAFM